MPSSWKPRTFIVDLESPMTKEEARLFAESFALLDLMEYAKLHPEVPFFFVDVVGTDWLNTRHRWFYLRWFKRFYKSDKAAAQQLGKIFVKVAKVLGLEIKHQQMDRKGRRVTTFRSRKEE